MNQNGILSEILDQLNQVNILEILLIIAGATLLSALAQRLLPWMAERLTGRHRLNLLATVPVLRLLLFLGAVTLIVPRIISPTFENLVALLGALGLALGFAFRDYASSLLAGVVTLYEAPYRPGDWIEVDGAYGEVQSIGLRAAEIVTPDDTVVTIPHLKLWDKLIYNANNGSQYLMQVTDFYLHPQHDANLARATLEDVALTSPYLQLQRPITVIVSEKPWGTHYRLKAYPIEPRDQFLFLTDLTVRGKAALDQLGFSFATPPVSVS